mmetsp:Transcript_32719/g.87836  ORF Transcript_32719/g.87836 Transcript_32719/m.87836 type:complete len:315 (-) Transcript_32719:47-991(-)
MWTWNWSELRSGQLASARHAFYKQSLGGDLRRQTVEGILIKDPLDLCKISSEHLLDARVTGFVLGRTRVDGVAPPNVDVATPRKESNEGQTEFSCKRWDWKTSGLEECVGSTVETLNFCVQLVLAEEVDWQQVTLVFDRHANETEVGGEYGHLLVVPRLQLFLDPARLNRNLLAGAEERFYRGFRHPSGVHEEEEIAPKGEFEQHRRHHPEPLSTQWVANHRLFAHEKHGSPSQEPVWMPHNQIFLVVGGCKRVLGGEPHAHEKTVPVQQPTRKPSQVFGTHTRARLLSTCQEKRTCLCPRVDTRQHSNDGFGG